MIATSKVLREVINLWILLFCIHSSTRSGPKNVALAWKAEKSVGFHYSAHFSSQSPLISRLTSIRGGDIVHLRSIEETEEVIAENSHHDDQLVVVYFSSTNCPPCKKVSPLFEELSEEFGDKIVFCKVNVDENPASASKYQVTGWPTFLFLKKGEKVLEVVGGKLAEATLYDWVKLMAPKEENEDR
jgi:thioredoxin 1